MPRTSLPFLRSSILHASSRAHVRARPVPNGAQKFYRRKAGRPVQAHNGFQKRGGQSERTLAARHAFALWLCPIRWRESVSARQGEMNETFLWQNVLARGN